MNHRPQGRTPTADEHLAAIYFTRIDELSESAPATDLLAMQIQYDASTSALTKAALACVCGLLSSMHGSFAQAEHWFNVAASDAPRNSWISGWVASVHAGHLLWNGDVDLADEVLHEIGPTEPSPFFWPQLPLIGLYIDIFKGRIDKVKATLRLLATSDSGLMPAINTSLIAVVHARIAVSLDDLDEAEVTIREALLTTERTSRSAALLIDTLSHVMARRGRIQNMHRCHSEAMTVLERWPGLLASIHRRFHQLLHQLGLSTSPAALESHGRPKSDDYPVHVLQIRDLRSNVNEALESGTHEQADAAIDALLTSLTEHTRRFESFGARRLAIHNLADLSTLAGELGAVGRHADMFRMFYHALQLTMTDTSCDDDTERLRDRLVALVERSSTDGRPNPGVHQVELTDINQVIRRLDWRLQTEIPATPPPRWDEVELPDNVIAFSQLQGRLVRLDFIDGVSQFSDRGPADNIHAAISSLRLATAAVRLDASSGIGQIDAAADRLDSLLLGGCAWPPETYLTVMPNAVVQGIPWRLLPSLKSLEIGFGHRPVPGPARAVPRRVLIVTGPDHGFDSHAESEAIGRHYPEIAIIDDPSITATRLVSHSAAHDVVHLASHGRIDPIRNRATIHDVGSPRSSRERGSRTMADVVILGACDLASSELVREPRLAWILLSNGIKSVIFSPLDLGDREVRQIMPELHRLLAAGIRPERALRQLRFDDPVTQVAAESLVSYIFET